MNKDTLGRSLIKSCNFSSSHISWEVHKYFLPASYSLFYAFFWWKIYKLKYKKKTNLRIEDLHWDEVLRECIEICNFMTL